MATSEDELKNLKEKNNELVQKVQYWKMTAAQRENEKLDLMKEVNELRLKVIRLKSGGAAEARKLDVALQTASEEALNHLVQASTAVARTMELAKTYMRDRQELDTVSPRWSNMSNSTEKVHRVPPMMMGGQSIQPVVSLSRHLNLNGQRPVSRSPNARNISMRPVPMHMLQDVYIPLTRIDMRDMPSNNETGEEAITANDSGENITSMEEAAEESQNLTGEDAFDSSSRLDIVTEDLEPEDEVLTPPRARVDNPLEGPSWLLESLAARQPEVAPEAPQPGAARPGLARPPLPRPSAARRRALEPDSTTQGEEAGTPPVDKANESLEMHEFTPTVRRRKRTSPPPSPAPAPTPAPAPAPAPALNGVKQIPNERILQVLVPKMRLDSSDASPPKRPVRFDAPSPNGATDSRVIVLEELTPATERPSCSYKAEPHSPEQDSHRDSGDSDASTERAGEGRTRRNRKPVTYKEKPLNRKLRR